MGPQQLFLIILGIIVVGLTIAVGVSMFSDHSVKSNEDAIRADLVNLGADGYQYKIKTLSQGGGNGSYAGYGLESDGAWGSGNQNAVYEIVAQTSSEFSVKGSSKQIEGASVIITFDSKGQISEGPVSAGF
ncbi:MAG: hypothetical protein EPO24_00800 [Bacteroidetes bacterium]|nr:MAG: hypothetical protein EPO24_00800 [Bacteroidota bacterium]